MKNDSRVVLPVIQRLREIRLAWRFEQRDIAKRVGCNTTTISRAEAGVTYPSFKLLVRWADVLGHEISLWPKQPNRRG